MFFFSALSQTRRAWNKNRRNEDSKGRENAALNVRRAPTKLDQPRRGVIVVMSWKSGMALFPVSLLFCLIYFLWSFSFCFFLSFF